jgi:hypothetical protein
MQAVLPLPPQLDQRYQGMALANETLMLSNKYDEAREGFMEMNNLLLQEQPPNGRYHKGYPLHQIGMTLILSGKAQEALLYFILAYVEDLLSQEEEIEDEADDLPASKNLRGVYKVQEEPLKELKKIVKQKKKEGEIIHDPKDIFDLMARGRQVYKVAEPREVPDVGAEKRKPGKFESDWNKRVFVGGSYSKHLSEINLIKKTCKGLGFDPVVAFEFETPQGKVHHHALMLLHECCKAVFEVTEHVGQLMEIERLRDYEVNPLIVCQEKAHLSEMLEALLVSQNYVVKRYNNPEELERLVKEFLTQPE